MRLRRIIVRQPVLCPVTPTGFTLIELSIVLVIIGLIVGGVLAGQALIRAAGVRAAVAQIEKYNSAVNTFRGKYGALPGDLNAQVATQFGFSPRGQYPGEGDGNGIIQGVSANGTGDNYGYTYGAGETVMFWVDLTSANGLNINLIDGNFNTASSTTPPGSAVSGAGVNAYFPPAKIGQGNYVYVYSNNSTNYFGLSAVTGMAPVACNWCLSSTPNLSVAQAYSIDAKVDDGMPTLGNVTAQYADYVSFGPAGIGMSASASSPSPTTCYDTTSNQYSLSQNNGANVNCGISFRFQ